MYHNCETRPIILKRLTSLVENKTEELKGQSIWDRRKNLSYCILKVGYFDYKPILTNKLDIMDGSETMNGGKTNIISSQYPRQVFKTRNETMYGPETQLFSLLHSRLNFSITWVYVQDEKFGAFDEK